MKITLVLILLISMELASFNLPSSGGKYFEIIPDRFEVVLEDPKIAQWRLKVRKVNNVRCFVGTIETFIIFGNNYTVEVRALKKQGGEYRYMPFRAPPAPFCDVITNDNYVYPDVVKGSDFPADIKSNCPLPIGKYTFRNVSYDMERLPGANQFLQSGEYCGETSYYLHGEHVSTYRFYGFINNV